MPEMPATQAGLQPGDVVIAVDGGAVTNWEELSAAIRGSGGREVELTVRRGDETLNVPITPEAKPDKTLFGEVVGTAYVIGDRVRCRPRARRAVSGVLARCGADGVVDPDAHLSVVKILQGAIPAEDIGGPILIIQAAGQQAQIGLESLLHFMAVISINLGILNLLPIPILDGGHLLFCGIEFVMRQPLKMRHREIAQQVGLVILLSIMAFAFYNDILRVIRGWG